MMKSMSAIAYLKNTYCLPYRTAGAVCGRINATYRLSATILPSLDQSYTEGIREFYPKNFSIQDAKIPRFHPLVLARGLTILLTHSRRSPRNLSQANSTVQDGARDNSCYMTS